MTSAKFNAISRALRDNDIEALRQHCFTRGGLLTNGIRSLVWPLLVPPAANRPQQGGYVPISVRNKKISSSKWYDQVKKDTDRSLWHWVRNPSLREFRRKQLCRVISHTIVSGNGSYHYFQGLHDIASVLLLVCEEVTACDVLEKLCAFTNDNLADLVTAVPPNSCTSFSPSTASSHTWHRRSPTAES